MNFNSHTDAVVAATVALVNAVTGTKRRGRPFDPPAGEALVDAVVTALHTTGPQPGRPTVAEAAALARMAERLRVVFERNASGDIDAAAELVNELLRQTDSRPHLMRHDGQPWHVHFHGPDSGFVGGWSAASATALAIVLGGAHHDRLGQCTAPECDGVYVDTSRNGTRRYCSTACQNRVKTAAFRARQNR